MALYSGSGMPNFAGVGAKTVPLMLVVPQTLASTWPHVWLAGQVLPQSSEPPQPSPILPQYWAPFEAVHEVIGLQAGSPQRYEVPRPPQVSAPVQDGQAMVPPQLSPIEPQ